VACCEDPFCEDAVCEEPFCEEAICEEVFCEEEACCELLKCESTSSGSARCKSPSSSSSVPVPSRTRMIETKGEAGSNVARPAGICKTGGGGGGGGGVRERVLRNGRAIVLQ